MKTDLPLIYITKILQFYEICITKHKKIKKYGIVMK